MKVFFVPGMLITLFACGSPSPSGNTMQANGDSSYTIKGEIKGLNKGLALLTYVGGGNVLVDSSVINSGQFSFRGKLQQPQEVQLSFANENYNGAIIFFAENAAINIKADTADLNQPSIEGSKAQEKYEAFKKQVFPVNQKIEALNKFGHELFISGRLTRAAGDSLTAVSRQIDSERTVVISSYIKANPDAVVSAWAISKNLLFEPNPTVLEPLFNSLTATNQSGIYGNIIREAILSVKATTIGQPAIDFIQPDSSGHPITLSSFKGKYVLVDFWASWCGPCRSENPIIVKAYNQYKSKGFDIISISLDENRDAWIKAIRKDNLSWTAVSDLKGWKNEASLSYGVKGIPFNVLLDKAGIIIAKNLRGESLQNKLKELFPN